ncbi:MAG TPA: S24 family peptidase [Rhodocyclaceae bacterium]|jgi:repressor LexA|nr:S24 family peptidase [Rhodocyclaceae bacterium]
MAPPNRDPDHLARLQDYYAQNRRIPSMKRIAELMGFASKAASSGLMNRLADAGFVERAPDDDAWIPAHAFFARPVIDSVRAGLPQAANDPRQESIGIDNYLIAKPSRTVLLVVKGDSMIEAGLFEGDHIVVDRGAAARNNDIVVAIVDNEFTVKYLAQDKLGFYLKPGNPAYPMIRPQGQLEIYGVVVGSFRKYA